MKSAEQQRYGQARQLLALRDLHLRAAEKSWQLAREQAEERQRIVAARLTQVAALTERSEHLIHWLSGPGAAGLPAMNARWQALRAVLDDQLERAESTLADEQDDLAQSRGLEDQQRTAWLRAKAAVDAAEQLCTAARQALVRRDEARLELELDDAAVRVPLHATAHVSSPRRSA